MARRVNRLSALKVKKLNTPGWYPDGNGLYLQISPSGSKSWAYRYKMAGKERRQGLGSYPATPLELARTKAQESRKLRDSGLDPIDHVNELRQEAAQASVPNPTFKQCAEGCIEAKRAEWKNAKHASQWHNTIRDYVNPVLGDLPVDQVELNHVLEVLNPIWTTKTETATRVRQRIETIIDWARVRGYRSNENPARWRGHLEAVLPKPRKIKAVEHHVSLHYSEIPEFMHWLCRKESLSALTLTFIILTASRSGEARGAKEEEVDSDHVWNVPSERMKAGRSHRVPLSKAAQNVLKKAQNFGSDDRYFPGQGTAKPISDTAVLKLLKQYRQDLTIHGFRATFRDWCAECTNYPRELAEAALAHQLKSETERAYQRGDLLAKRSRLMNEWARYCGSQYRRSTNVTPIKSNSRGN